MSSPLLLKGVRVWDGDGFAEEDLLIRDGRIVRRGRGLSDPSARTVRLPGVLVLPGLVDAHVHVGEPGREDRESVATAMLAAARGGFTRVLIMPDTDPPVDDEHAVTFLLRRAEEAGCARAAVCAAITKRREGKELAELVRLVEAGAAALGDAGPVADASVMLRAFEYSKLLPVPLVVEARETSLAADGVAHEGGGATRLGLAPIPPAAEWTALARDLILAEVSGGRLHVQGISTARSLRMVEEAKARGVRVSAECGFHHLLLDHRALSGYDASVKLLPPLREASDVEALIEGVRRGAIDCIVTDHTPFTQEEKDVEFDYAPFGAAGLEVALAALHTRLVRPAILDWADIVRAMSEGPRRVLGLPPVELTEGSPCEITLFDPEREWRLEPETLRSKAKNTPFLGERFVGAVVGTFVGGRATGDALAGEEGGAHA